MTQHPYTASWHEGQNDAEAFIAEAITAPRPAVRINNEITRKRVAYRSAPVDEAHQGYRDGYLIRLTDAAHAISA